MLQEFQFPVKNNVENLEIHADNCKYNIDPLIYQQDFKLFLSPHESFVE